MFKNSPKILAHVSAVSKSNFVTPEYILNNEGEQINLFHRFCPHRMYPLAPPGTQVEEITCKFHGLKWDKTGIPINNDRNIKCGKANIGRSGLVLKNFTESDHQWVDDLSKETNLEYSHSRHGTSEKGSWLWTMDIQADLLHIRQGDDVVHPGLAAVTNLDDTNMYQGDGWALQTCSTGWWLCIYPYTFIEWSPSCLAIITCTPNDETEFGFKWLTQFYYDPDVPTGKRKDFETLEDVFQEDIETIEKIKGKYFPLITAHNRLEDHCVHFGKWVKENYSTNSSIT
jgi:hypothetical protein